MRIQSDMNCMTLIVGKGISETGRVLVAHNEDDPGHVVVRRTVVPAADHAPGETIPAEKGLARIPQAPHTLRYYWVEYISDAGGLTSADAFFNEKGVVITSNSMGWSKEDSDDPSVVKDGGLGFVLRRALAERAESARDGARILMELVDEWGYAPSGRAYTIADKNEAFMFQLARGRHYIGARVPDNAAVVMPNHYTFHTLQDCPEMFYPEDIVRYAIQKGWYAPKSGDHSDFDFAAAYQGEKTWKNIGNLYRQKHGQRITLDRDWDMEKEGAPFAVYPEKPVGLRQLGRIMRCHYEGTPDGEEMFGPGRSPHYVPSMRRICTGTTLESDLWELCGDVESTCVYTAIGRPCQVPYLPLHPLLGIPKELLCPEDPAEMLRRHLEPHPGVTAFGTDAYSRLRQLCDLQEMRYADITPGLSPMLDDILEQAFAEHAAVRKSPSEAARRDSDFMEAALTAVESRIAAREVLPLCLSDPLELTDEAVVITVEFDPGTEPLESELRFGLEYTHTIDAFAPARPGSLRRIGERRYSADFDAKPILAVLPFSGKHSFWLGGRTKDGKSFAAQAVVTANVSPKTE